MGEWGACGGRQFTRIRFATLASVRLSSAVQGLVEAFSGFAADQQNAPRQMENIWLRTKRYDAGGKVRSGTGGVCYVYWPQQISPGQRRVLAALGLI